MKYYPPKRLKDLTTICKWILYKKWNIILVVVGMFILGSTLHGIGYGIIFTSLMSMFYYALYKW